MANVVKKSFFASCRRPLQEADLNLSRMLRMLSKNMAIMIKNSRKRLVKPIVNSTLCNAH